MYDDFTCSIVTTILSSIIFSMITTNSVANLFHIFMYVFIVMLKCFKCLKKWGSEIESNKKYPLRFRLKTEV